MATLTGRTKRKAASPVWSSHQAPTRPARPGPRRSFRGRLAVLGTIAALVAVLVVAVAVIGQSGEAPPATGAAELVPANALLYIHLSSDPSRPAVRRALAIARRFPGSPLLFESLTARLDTLLAGSSNGRVDFATQVRPWLGSEAAFAVLDTASSSAGSLIVLDVRNRARASTFLAGVGAAPDGSYDGVPLMRQSGSELAFVRHYLILGQLASVQQAVDVAKGRSPSLATSSPYLRAAGGEPADRVLDAYASGAGVHRALVPRKGLIGALGILLDDPALNAAAISVSALGDALRVSIHRALDSRVAALTDPQPPSFTPTLEGVLPSNSTMMVDVKGLARAGPALLAAGADAGVAAKIGPLLSRLGSALSANGLDVHGVLSVFAGEVAIAVAPPRLGRGPAIVLVTRTKHQVATDEQLAELDATLVQVFSPSSNGPGLVPEVTDVPVAGATAHQLVLAPGFEFDYTVSHGLVVVSTSLGGIAAVLHHAHALGDERPYQTTLGGHPDQVSSLLFSNLNQLLSLGEQAGLIGGVPLTALLPDLQKIRAVGVASSRGESDTTTEALLKIQ